MQYQNVCVETFSYSLPLHIVSSAQIEEQLAPVYERLNLPAGRLELMTGIRERRFWDRRVKPGAISAETAATMTQMMVNGVQDGAASNARIDGVDVAGKTGTAENGDDDPYTLWFTGFAPADDPQYAITVLIEDGGGLGQTGFGNLLAAPIAKQVLEAVLNK